MNTDKLFTRAVAALPKPVRERLDGDGPLDWAALEDPGTGAGIGEAARAPGRLPDPVEALVSRLARDVGIAADDLAFGAECTGTAEAWTRTATIEAEGESYRIGNLPGGRVRTGIRPEAIAGYATLALELAAAVHETGERWIEAGERHQGAAQGASSLLAPCAVRMCAQLRSLLDGDQNQPKTTAEVARVLERAWNTQSVKTRAALSAIRLRVGRGARPPRRRYYTPTLSYRLHSYDPGEQRWLWALAEQASTAVVPEKHGEAAANGETKAVPAGPHPSAPAAPASDLDISALEARIRAANEDAGTLQLGSYPAEFAANVVPNELMRAATCLSDAVRRRMRDSYGIGFTQALTRLRNARETDAIRSEIEDALAGGGVPRWLEELATTLLKDTGAQTRDGTRTASIRLHPKEGSDAAYRAVEVETGAVGQLSPRELVEQVRLSLVFAVDAWKGLAALRNAGKESGWILQKGEAEDSRFSEDERETLEVAQRIEHVLDRLQRTRGTKTATALEEAAMAADAIKGIGPVARTAAGWPGTAETPDPRNPDEVARIATVADALHERIRFIANKFIASWITGPGDYGVEGSDHASARDRDATPPDDDAPAARRHAGQALRVRAPARDGDWSQP